MLGYYLNNLTTLLQNRKEGEGWEVSTISPIYVSDLFNIMIGGRGNAPLCHVNPRSRSTGA